MKKKLSPLSNRLYKSNKGIPVYLYFIETYHKSLNISKEEMPKISFVKSLQHKTDQLLTDFFYKPISKTFNNE